MSKSDKEIIIHCWNVVNDQFFDKSTEFVLEVTAERASIALNRQIDCGDVAEALQP